MKIGFFTDTYFPQVSGVATSIKTLKDELEKHGHEVYIFTTTDPNATDFEEDVIRMPSVPFVSFKDRRVVVRGMWYAYLIAKELELDLIHTHTEFGAGILGKMVGKKMKIPVIHTNHTTGVVCPSERVIEKLRDYGVTAPMRIIPTGIEIDKFLRPDITEEMIAGMRQQLGIEEQQIMLLSLSRISYEKNIQAIIQGLPQIIEKLPQTRLVIVGNGPYLEDLKELAEELEVSEYVQFTGEVPNEEVAIYYKAADYFVSASTSETQGLTYTEAMAAGVQCVAEGNAYLNNLFDHESLGKTFKTDSDFAPTLIDYIQANIKMDQTILDEKLFEISSTNFGNKMIEFYQDTLIYFDQLQMEKENADSIKKIKVKFTSLRK